MVEKIKIKKQKRKLYKITQLRKYSDKRGILVEFIKNTQLKKANKRFGQIYVSTLVPKEIRGNHYHTKKTEWFLILNGKSKVVLKDIETGEEKMFIIDTSKNYLRRIEIEPFIAHAFQNISNKPQIIIAHSNQLYHKNKPDTIKYEVIK